MTESNWIGRDDGAGQCRAAAANSGIGDMHNPGISPSELGAHLIPRAAELRSKTVNLRLALADVLIVEARIVMGYGDDVIEKMLNAAFPGGSSEYWSVQLSEPMLVRNFVHLLHQHQMGPTDPREYGPFNRQTRIEFALHGALRRAFHASEPFFIGNGLIEPRRAAEWIHSKPRWCEYLPASLGAYLSGEPFAPDVRTASASIAPIEASRRPIGRPTRALKICAAFEELKRLDKIDFVGPMTSIYPEIRRMITGGTALTRGLGDEAIRKQISPRWPH